MSVPLALGLTSGPIPLAASDTAGDTAATVPEVQAGRADTLVDSFGVQTHLGYPGQYQDTERVHQALTDLGVRHVRDDWYSNKPEMHAAMKKIASTGIRFNAIMGSPTTWDTPERQVASIAETMPTGVIESLEGANEWNLRSSTEWATELRSHQRRLWEAAKSEPATRDLPVLAPALGQRSGYTELGDLADYADYGNAHNYPGGARPSTLINEVTAAEQLVVPDKPVVFTEGGYHNAMRSTSAHSPVPESVGGIYAPRLLLEHFARGTKRFYNYELLDEREDPDKVDHEGNFGLLRHDYSPKPAYVALQKLLSLAHDPGPDFTPGSLAYEITQGPADLRHVLLQKRDGTFILMLWRDTLNYDRVTRTTVPVPEIDVRIQFDETHTVRWHRLDQPQADPQRFVVSSGVLPLGGAVSVLEIDRPATATGPAPTTSPEPSPSLAPEPTSEPTPDATPSPSATPSPTPTVSTTPSPSPTPTTPGKGKDKKPPRAR